jgi:hypothetical protein
MDYLTIMEAARRSGKSDKTIRRAIHKGLLAAHFPQPNRCEIAIKDLGAFLHGQVSGQLESLQEQRIAELEGRIQALEAQVQRLLEKPKALGAHRVTSPRERMAGLLPRHLVPLLPFAQMHNVSETTVHGAIEMGLLPVKRGSWTQRDGAPVALALDAKGQHALHQLYHDVPPFVACDQCPHATPRQAV